MSHDVNFSSFSALEAFFSERGAFDVTCYERAQSYQKTLTKPLGALGYLEELACWLSGWQRCLRPRAENIAVHLYAGNHGIAAQGVSAYPATVTEQMVANFQYGGAAINQLCHLYGFDLHVHVMDLASPTKDFSRAPAMDEATCLAALRYGYESVMATDADILVFGEMGIGNSTAAAALAAVCFGGAVNQWVGSGSGLDQSGLRHKVDIIEKAIAFHRSHMTLDQQHPWQCLCVFGGHEIAALVGAILACRLRPRAVILDGFICCAAAALLFCHDNDMIAHCLFGHLSAEAGHKRLVKALGGRAMLSLDMRLGEGSGAVLAANLLQAAVICHNGMMSFQKAGVSERIS